MAGPLLAIAAGAGLLGKLFGNAAKGSADQRYGENYQNLQQTQMMNSDALARAGLQNADNFGRANLDLNRKRFQQNEPGQQARQAMIGSLLQRIQPLKMSGLSDRVSARMPKMNSIIDALGPEARSAGGLLAQRGLSGLESGGTQFQDVPALNLPPATMAALQKSGLLEKLLGAGGLIGSTVGALGDMQSVSGQNNRTPDALDGHDMYGNPNNFQIPRPGLVGR